MEEYIGREVKKELKGLGTLSGTVKSYDSGAGFFEIVYDGGVSENLDLSQLLSVLNGSHSHQERVVTSTTSSGVGRKPKKRRRIEKVKFEEEEGNNSGNDAVAEVSFENCSDLGLNLNEVKVGVNLNHGLNLDLNNDVVVNLIDEDGGGVVDLNRCEGLNLDPGLDLNIGVDLNVEKARSEPEEKLGTFEKSLNRSNVIDLNVDANGDLGYVSEDIGTNGGLCFDLNLGLDDESKNIDAVGDEKEMTCFGEDGESGEKVGSRDSEGVESRDKEAPLNLDISLAKQEVVDGTLQEVEVQWTSPDATRGGLEVQNGVSRSMPKGRRGRKKRKLLDASRGVTETVLRRSTRRARIDTISAEDNVSCAIVSNVVSDPLASPAVSVVSEEKVAELGQEDSEKHDVLPPKMDLPPSSSSLDLDGIPVLDVFSVYAFLRSFSTLLFLSPFELEDFVACIKANAPSLLFDSIHISLLQMLRKHLESLSDESSESASNCLRSLNWDLLDLITWPVFMVEYLVMHSSGLKPRFDLCQLKLFESDYYKQPASLKIEILRCLCDDVTEVEAIRSELNRRTLAAESMDCDRTVKFDSSRKRRAAMDVAAGSSLSEEVVDESADWNSDECCLCKMDGNLICCDGCPAAFHSKCVGVASSHLPEGDWYCPECLIDKKMPPWLNVAKSIRGAELLASDPYGRLYYSCCSYLLVSDSWEDEFSIKFYHRNDLPVVVGLMKSSEAFYVSVLSAIFNLWDTNCMSAGAKCVPDSQLKTTSSNFPVVTLFQNEDRVNEGKQVVKISSCSDDVGYAKSETVDPSLNMGKLLPGSVGSAETSQAVTDNQHYKEAGTLEDNPSEKVMETRNALKERKGNESVELESSTTSTKGIMSQEHCAESYVNYYSFARMASSVVEELTKKLPDKSGKDAIKTEEEIISAQLKAISSSIEFCWPNVQNLNVDAGKEKCGWCFSCKFPECERDCLLIQNNTETLSSDSLGVHSKENNNSHLVDVMCYIVSVEDRLLGLLLGPWLNPHHSQNWRTNVLGAHGIASLRTFLLTLESNLRPLALIPDWLKQVDSVAKMGSAHHVVISSARVSSRHGIGKKKARHLEPEANPSSNAGSGLGLFWWRGGRLSRGLFNWKVLPHSLARKAARQGGCKKIQDIFYADNSDFAKRSKCIAWRAAVETSRTVEQLALQVRDLDAHIRWNDIGNINILAMVDKESQKAVRSFKKVIVRRKSSEGSVVRYLLDFGKRRFLPDIVVKCGTMLEESSNERKRYWLEESHMPLHLLKGFEEKRIARRSSKMSSGKHRETNRIIKKSLKKKGFSYLFLKAERSEYHQCGHCNKDVQIREAVSCQYCECFFHKRHVRKSNGVVAAECAYTCHKCVDGKNGKQNAKRGRIELQESKKASKTLRPLSSKIKTKGTKNKQPGHSKSSKKEPVVIPLRRSARRAKFVVVQNKKIGRKRGKQTKAGRGRPKKQAKVDLPKKKNPVEVAWQKKRMQLCRIYWLNGLLLSQKPNDERVTLFRTKKLLVLSGELVAMSDQPKCSLCGEIEHTPTSNYIACEVCGDWFHGDAFDLTAERITKLIGFKCHNCRQRVPPLCAHLHVMSSKAKQVVLENTEGELSNEACYTESISSKGLVEQRFYANEESKESNLTGDSEERHPQGTIPDSFHAENACSTIISSEQRETIDSCHKMDIELPDEPGFLNNDVNCINKEGDDQKS